MTTAYGKVKAGLEKRLNQRVSPDVPCPDCGAWMVYRKNRADGSYFLGCNRFAKGECKGTREIPDSIILELEGNERLPGL